MEYPGSKLSRRMRRLILILYIIVFLFLCPIIILYSSGYRYDWKQGFPRRTGAISINVEPTDAQVFLNNVKQKRGIGETEVRLTSVPPGKYTIKITKNGYYDWVKEVEVKEMQTIYIKEVFLTQKNDPQLLDTGTISAITLAPSGDYLAYGKNEGDNSSIWLRNLNDNSAKQILNFKSPTIKLSWDGKNNYLAISAISPPYKSLIILAANNPEKNFDLVKKIKTPIEKYQWGEMTDSQMFFSTKTEIKNIFSASQRVQSLSKNNFLDWQMENNLLWTLQSNSTTQQINIIKDTLGFSEIFNYLDGNTLGKEWTKTKFLTAVRNNVLLKDIDDNNTEALLVTKNHKFSLNAEKVLVSEYNNWWLMWSPFELWGYVEGEEPTLINRSGEQLREVLPIDKYNSLALVWANNVTILYPYYLVTHALINIPLTDTTVDTKNRIIYFGGNIKSQDGLWKLVY